MKERGGDNSSSQIVCCSLVSTRGDCHLSLSVQLSLVTFINHDTHFVDLSSRGVEKRVEC